MNNGGAEKISIAGQGASVTLNHLVAPAPLVMPDSLKDMLLRKKTAPIVALPAPAAPAPVVVAKPVEKKEDGLSIETSKLVVDEKELGIKAPVIIKEVTLEQKPEVINEQKLTSKQNKESDGSFQIETTVMEAEEQQQAQKQAFTGSKPVAPAAKKVEKKQEKKKEESHDFVIETTVATPQLMKSMIGDNSQIIPDFEETKDEPKESPKPMFAPKNKGLQGTKPESLVKAAPKALVVKNVTSEAKEISIESSSLTLPDPAPKEVVGDAIAGAFDALPGFESSPSNTTNSTILAQKGITIEDTR